MARAATLPAAQLPTVAHAPREAHACAQALLRDGERARAQRALRVPARAAVAQDGDCGGHALGAAHKAEGDGLLSTAAVAAPRRGQGHAARPWIWHLGPADVARHAADELHINASEG
eukprot:CAMPEP_0202860638 /NCGR_PEP_ID=MMETSP1391-20130828/2284_1 /ASSEMBLY_ACC=CAM_ASM_000867 /TAXON_ID=1034604 /ORGANISM="Chlamydomonas leiostraca, Strain SAG 11-49" /LENGTH=116 /DNA_ID=CAMNT_0049539849 /DNA_START=151 /DNA_END=502 /DNA_ORIENTATION=+